MQAWVFVDEEIEEVEWSMDGNVIVMGAKSGMLLVLDAETTEFIFAVVS